jgi:hypothetical protein
MEDRLASSRFVFGRDLYVAQRFLDLNLCLVNECVVNHAII